jgi:hypothetical protein
MEDTARNHHARAADGVHLGGSAMKLSMALLFFVFVAFGVLFTPNGADAVSANCLPVPLPSGPQPGNPTFNLNVQRFTQQATFTLWRQACVDSQDFVILLRVAPTTPQFFTCGPDFFLLQDGIQFNLRYQVDYRRSICSSRRRSSTQCSV